MLDFEIDNSAFSRRIVQAVCDIAHRPLTGLRVLDLACAHGHYAFEMAKLGANVLGIEGRASWLEQAQRTKQALGLNNVEFVQDDVRNLSKARYGSFDIVLCLGILYHLDAPDVFNFIEQIYDVCQDFAVFETHFAHTPEQMRQWHDREYWGMATVEHSPGTPSEDKLKELGASLDNEQAFWLTQASLCNLLQHVGFTSVHECRNPMANLYVGPEWEFKLWGNRITLAAIKGQQLSLFRGPGTPTQDPTWPEDIEPYRFESYLQEREIGSDSAAPTPQPQPQGLRALIQRLFTR